MQILTISTLNIQQHDTVRLLYAHLRDRRDRQCRSREPSEKLSEGPRAQTNVSAPWVVCLHGYPTQCLDRILVPITFYLNSMGIFYYNNCLCIFQILVL